MRKRDLLTASSLPAELALCRASGCRKGTTEPRWGTGRPQCKEAWPEALTALATLALPNAGLGRGPVRLLAQQREASSERT